MEVIEWLGMVGNLEIVQYSEWMYDGGLENMYRRLAYGQTCGVER